MQVSRRGLFGFLGGLLVLGRTKPLESKQVGVSEGPQGRKLFALCDWARDSDIGVTVVYWRDEAGTFYIHAMHECTAEQVEDQRCPCRRYFPGHGAHLNVSAYTIIENDVVEIDRRMVRRLT